MIMPVDSSPNETLINTVQQEKKHLLQGQCPPYEIEGKAKRINKIRMSDS